MSPTAYPVAALIALALGSCTFTDNRQVELRPEHLVCSVDDDCTYAVLACSSCGTAVAKLHAQDLIAETERICRGYRGPVVDCIALAPPQCNAGICSAPPGPRDPTY